MLARDVTRLLPEIFARTHARETPLAALVEAMVALLDPVDHRLRRLDSYFDPYRAPNEMVPYLAAWVDLGWLPVRAEGGEGLSTDRLRGLIAEAPRLASTRGTAVGLRWFLEIALHEPAITVRGGHPTQPFHVVVELPPSAAVQLRLAELIVRHEKPANLTHEIVIVKV